MPSKHGPKVEAFYHTKEWKKAKEDVLQRDHHLCVLCGKPGFIVHHIKPLTEDNVSDPSISLSSDNLETLCEACHNTIHFGHKRPKKRCRFDQFGRIMGVKDYPPGS